MAVVLNEFPNLSPNGRRRPSQYDQYLDGQVWRIELGEHDGPKNERNLASCIRLRAAFLRKRVRIHGESRRLGYIVVQAFPVGDANKGGAS